MIKPHACKPSTLDNEGSQVASRYTKYRAGCFSLRTNLGPVIGYLYELRLGGELPEGIQSRLRRINLALVEIVDDDELGMIEASPEQRVGRVEFDR